MKKIFAIMIFIMIVMNLIVVYSIINKKKAAAGERLNSKFSKIELKEIGPVILPGLLKF